MSYGTVLRVVGRICAILSVVLILPLIVSLIYGESIFGFAVAMAVSAFLAAILILPTHRRKQKMFSKEGFACVALSWVVMSLIGAIPFWVEGAIPNYVDALFESVSGFTTTGASILSNVEAVGRGLLFWRSFTHWIGGMGILVLMMAVLPMSENYSIFIMRAETTGPEAGKLVPRVRNSSMILYLMYISLTVVEVIFLLAGGMSFYEAVLHSMGTAGTGGFGIKSDSIGGYSPYLQTVIGVFMMLFGVNFNLYFCLLLRRFGSFFKNEELLCYGGIITVSTALITLNVRSLYAGDWLISLRHSFFQVSSVMTTTGYSTTDFDAWPNFSKTILALLMFIGACAGSTAGGIKVSRLMILVRSAISEIKHLLRPNSYNPVTLDKKPVDTKIIHSTLVFFLLYMMILFGSWLLISLENYDMETSFSSVLACLSNIGPGLGLAGPAANFAFYSSASKLLLSFCMLVGRLEVFPVLALFSPYTWRRSSRF